MPPIELEPFAEGRATIRRELEGRLRHLGLSVVDTEADWSTPRRPGETSFVRADGRIVEGHRLLFLLQGDSSRDWASADRIMREAGFEPYGPRTELGQTYQSQGRAWVVLDANPKATRAVDRTGKAWLGWVEKKP